MEDANHEREHFFGAAKVVASLTMLSRVFGLVRDMVIVPLGGAVLADRFWLAFSIPNFFRRLFGEGALSAAFVPVFTDVAESEGWQRARAILANVTGVVAVALAGLVVLIELGLWAAWEVLGDNWTRAFMLQLAAVMLPFMFTVCLLALGSAALNCKGHFAYPAFAPIILNIVLIATAAWVAPALGRTETQQFFLIALSLVAAGMLQLIGVFWLLRRAGLAAMPTLRPIQPQLKRIVRLMAPMVVPLSILQLSAFADRVIALMFAGPAGHPYLPLRDGVVRCLYVANRLYQLPMGVLAISIATVTFPLLSRYATRRDVQGLRDTTNRALRLGAFLGIPAAVGLILLARPVIAFIFEGGQFFENDTKRAAFILQMYCLGMWAYFWNHVLLRAFFAQKDTRTPMILACVLAGTNLALVVGGIFTPLASGAIGLATAITQSTNALVLIWVLRRRWGRIGFVKILISLLRIGLATAAMAGAIAMVLLYAAPATGKLGEQTGRFIIIAAGIISGAVVFFLAAAVMRCPELPELWGSLQKKTPRKPPTGGGNNVQ